MIEVIPKLLNLLHQGNYINCVSIYIIKTSNILKYRYEKHQNFVGAKNQLVSYFYELFL